LFADQRAGRRDPVLQIFVLRRINQVYAASDGRNRPGVQRPHMGGGIDSARETEDDDVTGLA
jgi:hypothetical protein